MGRKLGVGRIWSFCLGFSITRRAARAIWRRGNKAWGRKFFGQKCELIANFSATMATSPRRERREVWREKRKVRIFGKGKCKLIANFSATVVTSLPSLALSLSLSLSLCLYLSFSLSLSLSLSLSHRKYLTHNKYRKRFRASYYTRRGSAWYIVREWLSVSSGEREERERERERERRLWRRPISRWNREWSCNAMAIIIIGASLSEPHTDVVTWDSVTRDIYIYIYI